jgi:hypothetical protein
MSKKQISISYWILGLIMLVVSGLSLTGKIQQVITFQDPLNEFAFFMMTSSLGVLLMMGAFIDDTKLQ